MRAVHVCTEQPMLSPLHRRGMQLNKRSMNLGLSAFPLGLLFLFSLFFLWWSREVIGPVEFCPSQYLTEERSELHNILLESFTSECFSEPFRQVWLFFGLPGAGKTTYINSRLLVSINRTLPVIGPDIFLEWLGEFQEGREKALEFDGIDITGLANSCHEEAKYLAGQAANRLIQSGCSFIYDGTGSDLALYTRFLNLLFEKNFTVTAVYIHTSLEKASQRVDIRASETHRFVPQKVLRRCAAVVLENFRTSFATTANASLVFDNDTKDFMPVWSQRGGRTRCLMPAKCADMRLPFAP
mmetsp:Transcript_7231/g.18289  ORF Transcript_7231/g.18289 Transcript_7231/m.18289 type:complete len:298 (-) Transcript_7231:239-1132(-)